MSELLGKLSLEISDLVSATIPSTATIIGDTKNLAGDKSGSGWLFDFHGHFVTNHHVVFDMAPPIKVRMSDGVELPASLIGSDAETDLAVIGVDGVTAAPLPLRTDTPRVGEICIAIGAPFGLPESASLGVVSGLNRQGPSMDNRPIEEMIQTDAAINPGNSGGPLIDSTGRVIGVNTLTYTASGHTVNFAVPSETVAAIIPELIQYGSVLRATIGARITQTWATTNDQTQRLVEVVRVTDPDSSLAEGDFIISMGGLGISRKIDLQRVLNRSAVETDLPVQVLREGKVVDVTLRPKARPAE